MNECFGRRRRGEGVSFRKLVLLPDDTFQRLLHKNPKKHIEAVKNAAVLNKNETTGRVTKADDQDAEKLMMIREEEGHEATTVAKKTAAKLAEPRAEVEGEIEADDDDAQMSPTTPEDTA